MKILIETKALRTFLFGLLSCKCPVTRETEKRLFDLFFKSGQKEQVDFLSILAVADRNPERTPIHALFDFSTWARNEVTSFSITENDVLRYLGSSFHYNMVVSNHQGIETANPGLLLSHVLVPVSIRKKDGRVYAAYESNPAIICFKSIVRPDRLETEHEHYGLHMGVLVCGLTEKQVAMLNSHQKLIRDFFEVAGRVRAVDFKDLPPYGDHFSQCVKRFNRNGFELNTIF